MRILICLAILALSAARLYAQPDDQKSFVKTLDPGLSSAIIMDVTVPVEGKVWEENYVRVLLYVSLVNGTESTLKQLAQIGRYTVEGKIEGDKFVVTLPNIAREVVIKGQKIEEKVHVEIMTPGGIVVTDGAGQQIQILNQKVEDLKAKGMAMRGAPIFKPFECALQFTGLSTMEVPAEEITVDGVKLSELLRK